GRAACHGDRAARRAAPRARCARCASLAPPPPSGAPARSAPGPRVRPGGPTRRRCRLPPPGAAPRASPSLVRPTRCGEEYDLAVAREVEPQALLGARHQDGAALRGADTPLQIGAVRLEVGAPGAQLGELAPRAEP